MTEGTYEELSADRLHRVLLEQMGTIPGPTPTPVLSALAVLLPAMFNVDLCDAKIDELC